jgi:hypothetical protein
MSNLPLPNCRLNGHRLSCVGNDMEGVMSMPGSTPWSAEATGAGAGGSWSSPGSTKWSAGKSLAEANGCCAEVGADVGRAP